MSLTPQQLTDALLSRGYTQQDIARICGISQPSVHRIAKGKQPSPPYTVVDTLRRLYKKGDAVCQQKK